MKSKKDEFIPNARIVQGDKYDYSKVEYKDNKTKVCLICPEHGEFWIAPSSHLKGGGCPKCANEKQTKTLDKFIEEARQVHGDKFDYSKVEYINNKTKLCIICPKHGEFWQVPHKHLTGQGCPDCRKNSKVTFEEVLERAKAVHGDRYDYSKAEYTVLANKVTIIDTKCGREFQQSFKNHLKGRGCPYCGLYKNKKRKDTDKFIEEARQVHGDKYDYSKVEYNKAREKVCIICPRHGEFWQTASSHLLGCGCPKCGDELSGAARLLTTSDFIERAIKVHGNRYDYSKTNYVNAKEEVCITCPEHGDFWQVAGRHLQGCGCQVCGGTRKSNTEEFVDKARKLHKNKYDYSKVEYVRAVEKVCIICPEHGEFWMTPNDHLMGSGCPSCSCCYSKPELDIYDFVKTICNDAELCNRTILKGLELDVYIPSKKIAIEYDGLYWHSEENGKGANYHLNKTEMCAKQGIQLIHVFEDEWLEKPEIVKSRLMNILGVTVNVIYARKCGVYVVNGGIAQKFLEGNHIQGRCKGMYHYGLYYDGELVSLMTFGKMRQQRKYHTDYDSCYELLRFCSKLNTNVVGAAGKLLKAFLRDLKPSEVISYADKRWSQGNLYKQLGFEHTHNSRPNYFYVVAQRRENRFKYRKGELVKEGYDPNKSEREIMLERGIYRIYDCGTMVFKLKCDGGQENTGVH